MNYDEVGVSNFFKVTNYEQLDILEKNLFCFGNFDDKVYVLKYYDDDGHEYRKYSCYGTLEYAVDGDYDNDDCEEFFKELQKILPDNEVFIWHYTGNEGLRYNCSGFTVVSNKKIVYKNTEECIKEVVEEVTGISNNDYNKYDGLGDESYTIDRI